MSSINVRTMALADLELGLRLKSAANWNQTAADWRRVLQLEPEGCFVGVLNGVAVGTVATCIFGAGERAVAWIGMMLVDETCRGQGVGRVLMQTVLDWLSAQGVPTVRLDATPQGEPLYRKLGFEPDFTLTRYAGRPVANESYESIELAPVMLDDLPAISRLDQDVTNTDRHALWAALLADEMPIAGQLLSAGECSGFVLSRKGSNATQLGPCEARDSGTLSRLLRSGLNLLCDRPTYVDVPDQNDIAAKIVKDYGLTSQRPLLRMTRGRKLVENISLIGASYGPEKG